MERRVDGLRGDGFFHKHHPAHFPDWVATTQTPTGKGPMRQVVVDDLATLVLVTNFGGLTLHVPTCTVDHPFHPDQLVVDLDPPPDAPLDRIREAALLVRAALRERDLPAFARWTGSKGVHVVVPLDGTATQDAVVATSVALADDLVARHPALLTVAFAKAERGERIYVDVGRNFPTATCVAPFTIRPLPGAPIVTPITWDELEHTGPTSFTIRDGAARLAADAWSDFRSSEVALPTA
jgi:bifunctional non-homologous end joining protein LigD